jgi:hypothetical protein
MRNVPSAPNPAERAKAADVFAGVELVVRAMAATMTQMTIATAPTTSALTHIGPAGGEYVMSP